MRTTILLPIIILVACSPQKSDDTFSDSTTVVATDTLLETPTETVSYAEAEPETETELESNEKTTLDSAWLNTFTEDPLGHNSYDGVVSYLDGRNIQHRDTVIDMITWVYFGSSSISINVTESYGDLVCSGFIEDPNYTLSSGITPGMSREEFMETSGISAEAITGNSFEYTINYDNEEFSFFRTVTFYFDEKSLTGVDYDLSTCVIYD